MTCSPRWSKVPGPARWLVLGAFAQDMIPHHEQAVTRSEPVPRHTGDRPVVALAKQIQQAQQPEIDQLAAWLKQWGAPSAMFHGEMKMPGMVDTQQVEIATMKALPGT